MFTFPEMWLARVILLVTSLTSAPWLDGIPELETEIIEAGTGTATEVNEIHVPIENFDVDVLINNTSYPIATQTFTDGESVIKLEKYQTKVTTLSDDALLGASYPKIDSATRSHTRNITSTKYSKAIWNLAPQADSANTPVMITTGTLVSGRRKLVYADLITLKRKLDDAKVPAQGRRLVLSDDHLNDLLEDRDRFANLLSNLNEGTLAPRIAGFAIYNYSANPKYIDNAGTLTRAAFQAVSGRVASVCFVETNVAKKTGNTKQYFSPADQDPANQTNRLNYRHYFIATPFQGKHCGAIIDAQS